MPFFLNPFRFAQAIKMYLAKASHNSAQSMTSSPATLNISEITDEDTVFASNTYTVAETGTYLIMFNHALHDGGASIQWEFYLRINSTDVLRNSGQPNVNTDGGSMFYIAELTAGDTITVRGQRETTANTVIYDSGNYSRLEVVRLPDASSYFRARMTVAGADFSTTDVDVIWNDEVTDTGNIYDSSTGIISVPNDKILISAANITVDPASLSSRFTRFRPQNTTAASPIWRQAQLAFNHNTSVGHLSAKFHNASWTQKWVNAYSGTATSCGFQVSSNIYNVITGCLLPNKGYVEVVGCKSGSALTLNTWEDLFFQTENYDANNLFYARDPSTWNPISDPLAHFYPTAGHWLIIFGVRLSPEFQSGGGTEKIRSRLNNLTNSTIHYGDTRGTRGTNATDATFRSIIKCDGTENFRPEIYLEYVANSPAVLDTTNGCYFIAVKLD